MNGVVFFSGLCRYPHLEISADVQAGRDFHMVQQAVALCSEQPHSIIVGLNRSCPGLLKQGITGDAEKVVVEVSNSGFPTDCILAWVYVTCRDPHVSDFAASPRVEPL